MFRIEIVHIIFMLHILLLFGKYLMEVIIEIEKKLILGVL